MKTNRTMDEKINKMLEEMGIKTINKEKAIKIKDSSGIKYINNINEIPNANIKTKEIIVNYISKRIRIIYSDVLENSNNQYDLNNTSYIEYSYEFHIIPKCVIKLIAKYKDTKKYLDEDNNIVSYSNPNFYITK